MKLDRRIRENDQLLKKKIDRMVHLFGNSQKAFYNAYIKSRLPAASAPGQQEAISPSPAKPAPEPEKESRSGKSEATSEGKPAAKKPVQKPAIKPGTRK